MSSYYWIKLYHELLDDPKAAMLPDRLWRRMVECFLLAGTNGEDGVLPELEQMAWRLRQSSEILEAELAELASTGILEQVDGNWKVAKFKERQRARTPSERVVEYRKRQAQKDYMNGWFDEEER